MKSVRSIISLAVLGLLLVVIVAPGWAGTEQKIVVRVDGLSCPFCGFGLEKKLKRIEGVQEVKLLVDKGLAELRLAEGKTVTEAEVRKAVEAAGFTPREVTFHGAAR